MNVFQRRNIPEQIRRNLYAQYARRTAACFYLVGLVGVEQHYVAGGDNAGLIPADDLGRTFYDEVYFKITVQMRRTIYNIDHKKIDVLYLRMLDNFKFINQIQPP
jgi:hypothetical protein